MKRKTVDDVTTLTLLDGVAGCDEIDLPIGRLVRVEGDAVSTVPTRSTTRLRTRKRSRRLNDSDCDV